MTYYITDGQNYLNRAQNGVIPASFAKDNANLGRWEDATKASHVLAKSKVAQSNGMRVLSDEQLALLHAQALKIAKGETTSQKIFHLKTQDKPGLSAENADELKHFDFFKFGKSFANMATQLDEAADALSAEVSKEDLIQQDLLHKIEFSNFNDTQSYAYMRLLKECRLKRREAKNNLFAVQRLQAHLVDVSNMQKEFAGMDDRKYKPRVLKGLFED